MALGKRKPQQDELFTPTAKIVTGPGHPFYSKLNQVRRDQEQAGPAEGMGRTPEAKETQALLIAITHNLLLCYEQDLERRHDVANQAENQRLEQARAAGEKTGWPLPALVLQARPATQISVKFIRWLRHALREELTEAVAVPRLRQLYASL